MPELAFKLLHGIEIHHPIGKHLLPLKMVMIQKILWQGSTAGRSSLVAMKVVMNLLERRCQMCPAPAQDAT